MTISKLYENHKKGKVTKQTFLYEARKEDNLPWVTNLTSYEDAVKILKNKGIITEGASTAMTQHGSAPNRFGGDVYNLPSEENEDDLNELSPQTRYNAAIKAIGKSNANRDNNAADYRKAVNQGNKFVTQIDPEVKNVVNKFANSLGLEARIEKGIRDSTYEPTISIKMGPESSKPQIVVFITKDSNKIEGQLPDEASERRLGNIIKQIQKKELNVETNTDSLNEAHDLTTDQIIDRLNPYEFKKGVEYEMSKLKVLDNISYEKVKEKVAKKMAKDPLAYRYTQLANSKQIEKDDTRLKMTPVKGDNFVDKDNGMKKIKGHADEKKNTSAPKTENRKGKPKGVKEMKGSKKKPAGVKDVMKSETKETVLNEMIAFFKKKDRLKENDVSFSGGGATPQARSDFHKGSEVITPDGSGIVKECNGSIVSVQMEDGSEKDFTFNVLDAAKEKANQSQIDADKAERDKMWSDWDKRGEKTFGGMTADPKSSTQDLLKKLKGLLEKFKMKKEAVDVIKAKNAQGSDEVIDTVPAGQGNKAIQDLKKKISQKGGSITSLKTTTVK
jgi:hypothetical protein